MRAALFTFSRGGCATARRILAALPEEAWMCYTMPRFEEPGFLPLDKAVYGASFSSMDALIFVGACGIAVREIAPYVKSKKTDPAVVCIDEAGRFVIPLLSGHIGGANALAVELAEKLEVSPTHVKHIESGHRKPSIEILFEITKILNISLDGVVFSKNESARTDTRKEIDRLLDVSDEASLHFILSVLEALREKEQAGVR